MVSCVVKKIPVLLRPLETQCYSSPIFYSCSFVVINTGVPMCVRIKQLNNGDRQYNLSCKMTFEFMFPFFWKGNFLKFSPNYLKFIRKTLIATICVRFKQFRPRVVPARTDWAVCGLGCGRQEYRGTG